MLSLAILTFGLGAAPAESPNESTATVIRPRSIVRLSRLDIRPGPFLRRLYELFSLQGDLLQSPLLVPGTVQWWLRFSVERRPYPGGRLAFT